jgi:hypothetical protein
MANPKKIKISIIFYLLFFKKKKEKDQGVKPDSCVGLGPMHGPGLSPSSVGHGLTHADLAMT